MTQTPAEVLTAARQRIARNEEVLRAWVVVAEEVPAGDEGAVLSGLLAGVAIGVKDIIDTQDLPTQRGSVVFEGRHPTLDASVVSALRRQGAVVVGKTVTTEFGMRDPGPTTNPHDPTRTPGGSSSGSAAAVAAGHVDLAIGTQTGGSVIRPAAYCGVWGLKPTSGVIDRFGVQLHSSTIDTVGFLANSAAMLGRALAVAIGGRQGGGTDAARPASAPAGPLPPLRILASRRDEVLEASARLALDEWIAQLGERKDLHVEVVAPPIDDVALDDAHRTITQFEAARLLEDIVRDHAGEVSDHVLHMVEEGSRIDPSEYRAALAAATRASQVMDAWLGDGLAIAPSARGVAPRGLESTGSSEYCRVWTMLGNPSVNMPGLVGEEGMPFGVQLITARQSDFRALELAERVGRLTLDPQAGLD